MGNATLPALSGNPAPTAVPLKFAFSPGMNLSGAEFNSSFTSIAAFNGGDYSKWYGYPSTTNIDLWIGRGYKMIRVPVMYTHLINFNTNPWTWTTTNRDQAPGDIYKLAAVVDYIIAAGGYVILDMHSYGYMYPDDTGSSAGGLIGSNSAATDNFAYMWRMLADYFKTRTNIAFDLSNEPHTQTNAQWGTGAQLAINHIRDVGAGHPIFVEWVPWAGARNFVSSGAAAVAATLTDPCRNLVIECHQYVDYDFSGTHYADGDTTTSSMATLLTPLRDWCASNGAKWMIGEFGASNTASQVAKLKELLDFMDANKATCIGWTYWAAGAIGTGYALYPNDGSLILTELNKHLTVTNWSGGATNYPPASTPPTSITGTLSSTDRADTVAVTGVVAGATSVTWDPNNKGVGVTLSNGNLTATKTVTGDQSAVTNASFINRKIYCELQVGATPDNGFGICTGAFAPGGTYPGSGTTSWCVVVNGDIRTNGALVGAAGRCGAVSANGRMCIALDLVNSLVWFKNGAGNWNGDGSANPATGTNGLDISGLGSPNTYIFLAASGYFSGSTFTLKPNSADWTYSAPSGFESINTVQQVSGIVAATEAKDTLSLTMSIETFGIFGATDSKDTFAATGLYSPAGFIGTLAATDATDVSSITGVLAYNGTMAAREDRDRVSASGSITPPLLASSPSGGSGGGTAKWSFPHEKPGKAMPRWTVQQVRKALKSIASVPFKSRFDGKK